MDTCSKCLIPHQDIENRVEGGICYKFCPLCALILNENPETHQVFKFLQKDHGGVKVGKETKSILEARIHRAEGSSPWKKEGRDL